ncbi:helix-turn-helix domain-containing protein [Nocardia takedensis]|uniref:helix-turn-helix domain-containing protein n=1 Tax=Nocardia takedensis TaxID=259390 RepID=UPI003F765219
MSEDDAQPTELDDRYVGQQVRTIRRRRGISQKVLADRVGLSRGAIAKYEAGERPVDSRRILYALAGALGVRTADLTNRPIDQADPTTAAFHAAIADIEAALWMAGDGDHTAAPRTLDQLAGDARRVGATRLACDFVALGPLLGPLITDCYRHTRDRSEQHRMRAWSILAAAAFDTAIALRVRGYGPLAWTAAQVIDQAADSTGDTAAVAAGAFARSQVLLSRPGAVSTALGTAVATAAAVQPTARTVNELETYGMLHLQSALTAAALGKDPSTHFTEAADTAARLDTASPGETMVRNPTFGPENVTVWRMSAALEAGEPGQVLALAPTLDPHRLAAPSRAAQYFVEVGRAHAMQRDHTQSLHALLRAEHIAPQHVRGMTHVRELVGHMMRTARRDLTTGQLGQLAVRVGAVPG